MSNLLTELLTVANPDEKIKEIVQLAISNRQNEVKLVTDSIADLNKQQTSGVYYTPVDMNPSRSTIKLVAVAVLTILSDVLYGFQSAAEYMKQHVDTIESETNKRGIRNNVIGQLGGNIKVQATVLNRLISSANKQITKIVGGANANANDRNKTEETDVSDTNIGETTNATDKSTSSIAEDGKEFAVKTFHAMKDVGELGLKSGIKWSGDIMVYLVDAAMDMTGQVNLLDTPFDKLSPELNKKVLLLAGVLKGISTNPATKQAVREIAQAIAVTIVEILKEIRPQVNKVADQGTEMLAEVSEKFVTGATGTGISIIQAFLAEIPWVGGMIDLFIAIGKGFNTLTRTFRVFVTKSGKMVVTSAQTIKNTEATAMKGKERIMGAVNNVADTLKKSNDTSAITSNKQLGQSGGGATMYNNSPKIQNGGKRLRRTLKLFHKTLPRLKFMANGNPIRDNRTKKSRK